MLVIIEVHNGVASVLTKSEGVEVNIRDYDTDGSEGALEEDEFGNTYVEEIYEADEII